LPKYEKRSCSRNKPPEESRDTEPDDSFRVLEYTHILHKQVSPPSSGKFINKGPFGRRETEIGLQRKAKRMMMMVEE
jgi:hypothetical protein